MATIAQIRDGLKARLATIQGLRPFDYAPGAVTPPAAVVYPETIAYGTSLREQTHDPRFIILVLVNPANDRTAQDALDAYLDPSGASSILAAVDADPTLGGAASYAAVTRLTDYGNVTFGGTEYLGAKLSVEVGMG